MALTLKSRYRGLPVYDAPSPSGEVRATVSMRLSEDVTGKTVGYQHLVTGDETMESLAARYYGTSEDWWRIADANPLMFPTDLKTGSSLTVPNPGDAGRIERTRSF